MGLSNLVLAQTEVQTSEEGAPAVVLEEEVVETVNPEVPSKEEGAEKTEVGE